MGDNRAYFLRSCIAFALIGVRLQVGQRHHIKPALTEDQRYEVADKVIKALRERHGYADWLDAEQPVRSNGPQWDYRKQMEANAGAIQLPTFDYM